MRPWGWWTHRRASMTVAWIGSQAPAVASALVPEDPKPPRSGKSTQGGSSQVLAVQDLGGRRIGHVGVLRSRICAYSAQKSSFWQNITIGAHHGSREGLRQETPSGGPANAKLHFIALFQIITSFPACHRLMVLRDASDSFQQFHDCLLGRSQFHHRHEILPSGHHQKGTQNLIRALHQCGEVLTSGAVTPGKPVLHGLLVRPGPTGHDLYAFAAGPG